jgi:type V secretory pathway adhesin AidA
MLGRITRLEFIIVTVAFLVLMLCSKPPRPGSANVEGFNRQTPTSQETITETVIEQQTPAVEVNEAEPTYPEPASADDPDPQPEVNGVSAQPEQKPTRMATVDARNCSGLKYDQIMQGEITVRWVWNGQKLVPEKVCVVEEANGVSTIWGFDQRGNAVLSEVGASPDSGQ